MNAGDDHAGGAAGPLARAPEVDPRLGAAVGKYRLLERIGHGGMGVVYAAEDTSMRRKVAVKVLPPSGSLDPEAARRFEREARAAASLSHPNVVAIYDVVRQDGADYLVLELVPGASAQERLQAGGALPWREATRVAADACRGLVATHAAGIVHRDIKPSNLFLPPDGGAKLGDFGLAKYVDKSVTTLTRPGGVLGTPAYMSPEQCRGEPLDERSDLYSLGATYYALLTGRPPFRGKLPLQVMFAQCSSPVPDPRAVVAGVPDVCARIVRQAMGKDPRERYATAVQMFADLESALASAAATQANDAVRTPTEMPGKIGREPEPPGTTQRTARVIREELFAQAALRNRFVTAKQLEDALALKRAEGPGAELADILVAQGHLEPARVELLRHAVDVAWRRRCAAAEAAVEDPAMFTDPMIGHVLAGEFRIERLLGRGGMGAVYLAEQVSLGRRVAVKLLPLAAMAASEEAVGRFRREARAAGRLQHPNIVQVHTCGEELGQHFIAMEFVQGKTLGDLLWSQRKVSAGEAIRLGVQVARALGAAHRAGIVHRDLKPDNIFLTESGEVKLGDFGLARDTSRKQAVSVTGQLVGTPLYMSPEQCLSRNVDGRADIYSLGATLFHALSGSPPYTASSVLELMNAHVSEPVPSVGDREPGVPVALDALIARMLQKDPARRPAGAEEVETELELILAAQGAPEPPRAAWTHETAVLPEGWIGMSAPAPAGAGMVKVAPGRISARAACVLACAVVVVSVSLATGLPRRYDPANSTATSAANAPAVSVADLLAPARAALANRDPGAALAILDKIPPEVKYGVSADSWTALRARVAKEANAQADAILEKFRALLRRGEFPAAETRLAEIEQIGVRDLEFKLGEARAALYRARDEAARRSAEALEK